MFENLTDKLERSLRLIKGQGRITEINVAETLKEIRRALIDADVNYKVAKTFTDDVKAKALGQDVLKSVSPGQMMTKLVRDELATLMGGSAVDIKLEGNPAVILISGLQGSGKTTFSGKLAKLLHEKRGRKVLLVAGDVYRPAAIDQLKVLGQQIGVEGYAEDSKNPVQIAENGIKYARQHSFNVVIVDTAGRLAIDEEMMREIEAVAEGRETLRDVIRGRFDDRSGCSQHSPRVQPTYRLRWCRADQTRRRYARRRRDIHPFGGR